MSTDTDTVWDQVKPKLLSVDYAREALASSEPLAQITFPLWGSSDEVARFSLGDGFVSGSGDDPVSAVVQIAGKEYGLTHDAVLEATSSIGLTQAYVSKTPHELIEPHLNWWFSNRDSDLKALVSNGVVRAFTRATIVPFSNVRLLDAVLERLGAYYGDEAEVAVDFKFHHDLKQTALRLVVPSDQRSPREGDTWSAGIQIRNSLIGGSQTSLEGYLFRWWCTNGAITTHAAGQWHRKKSGQEEEPLIAWARESVDEILGGMEHEFEAIEELANTPIPFDVEGVPDVAAALADVFQTYRVPAEARDAVIENAVNSDDLTMYGVMQSITQAANDPSLSEKVRQGLMDIGGALPRANSQRCQSCRRLVV